MTIIDPRASAVRGEFAMVLALTALIVIVSLVPRGGAAAAGLAVVALTLLAWHRRASAATSLGFLFATCLVFGVAGLGPQQIVFALAFGIYAVIFTRVAWLRFATVWLRLGARNGSLVALGVCAAETR